MKKFKSAVCSEFYSTKDMQLLDKISISYTHVSPAEPSKRYYIRRKQLEKNWIDGKNGDFFHCIPNFITNIDGIGSKQSRDDPVEILPLPSYQQLPLKINHLSTLALIKLHDTFPLPPIKFSFLLNTYIKRLKKIPYYKRFIECFQTHSKLSLIDLYFIFQSTNKIKIAELIHTFVGHLSKAFLEFENKLNNFSRIHRFFLQNKLENLSLKQIHKKVNELTTNSISFASFIKISRFLGLKYQPKQIGFSNSPTQLSLRKAFIFSMSKDNAFLKENIFYFDVTSFSECSFKRKVWNYPLNKNTYKKLFIYNLTHLLLAISPKGRYYVQFFKGNINSLIILSFFQKVYENEKDNNLSLTFILDNSPLHRTVAIKNFSIITNVKFRFTTAHSPFFNMAEYAFRYIKTGLRKYVTLR